MAKSVGVHYSSQADTCTCTLDRKSLVNTKKLTNKIDQFEVISVLIKITYFPQRGAQDRGFTNLHHG